jgi:HAD superfamily hydrolase (TIGR01509 family)
VVERTVLDILLEYIDKEGQVIPFIPELIELCKENNMKLGLATSSSTELMNAILKKLQYENTFDARISAENLKYGKPHPEVFLKCAEAMGVEPSHCIVIEDSVNGVISAKAAQMLVIAVPDDEHSSLHQFSIADFKKDDMGDVLTLFKTLFQFRTEAGEEPFEL